MRRQIRIVRFPLVITMEFKGLDVLQAHIPDSRAPGALWQVPLWIAVVFVLTTLFFVAADRGFAEWMPDGEIVVLALGFLILSRFFSQRHHYRRKYGERAFAAAFTRFSIPGLGIIMASIAHLAYIAGPGIPGVWWRVWLIALGYALVLIGITLWVRSVLALGIDNLVMLYVYFPAEGQKNTVSIIGMLRHPIYSAALDIGFGLALIHANWYALLVALLLPIFYAGWVRLEEEPELMERFPDYAAYRKRVPAFTPKPSDVPRFARFLLLGRV